MQIRTRLGIGGKREAEKQDPGTDPHAPPHSNLLRFVFLRHRILHKTVPLLISTHTTLPGDRHRKRARMHCLSSPAHQLAYSLSLESVLHSYMNAEVGAVVVRYYILDEPDLYYRSFTNLSFPPEGYFVGRL
jgi:hypothetical protein